MKKTIKTCLSAAFALGLAILIAPSQAIAGEWCYYEPAEYYSTTTVMPSYVESPVPVVERSAPVIIERPETTVIKEKPIVIHSASHHLLHLGIFPLGNFSIF